MFDANRNRMIGLPYGEKNYDDMLNQKSAVQVCQVASVVMETTRLVLSQCKNFLLCKNNW